MAAEENTAAPDAGAEAEAEEVVTDAEVVEDDPSVQAEAAAVEADLADPGREPEESGSGELAAARKERDEFLDLAQRTKADFENYRKRAAREAEEAGLRGRAALAERLLPAIDNLERALALAESDPAELAKGIEMVHGNLGEALKSAGVEAYDPAGEPFDPAWHEALSTVKAEGKDSGVVIETLARGYRLEGHVLRPARVVVSE